MRNSITVAQLQHDARRVLDRLQREGDGLLVTQRGRGRAVLVSVEAHERLRQEIEQLRVLALIEAGRRAVVEGRTRTTREVRQAFERRWRKARRGRG